MAIWNKGMFWVAVVQAVLTAAGLLLIWWTLVQTRRAANFAGDAAKASVAAVAAAERANAIAAKANTAVLKSVRVTEATAERQLRAYVLPDSAHIHNIGVGTTPIATVVIKNFGNTPARDMYCWAQIHIANYPAGFEFTAPVFDDPDGGSRSTLGPGSQHDIEIPCGRELAEIDVAAIGAKHAAFWVHGHVDYVDAFGEKRTTDFRFVYGGRSGLSPLGVMVSCREGNTTYT